MNKTKYVTQAAVIAALYAVLTHLQNILLPGSTTWAIQMRISEAMTVLAFFTPAAIPGLSLGCLLFNLTYAGTLPLDFLVGTLATFLAALAMWKLRNVKTFHLPLLGLLMPALTNAFLVGWELTVYIGGGFVLNAVYVALGELAVVLVLVIASGAYIAANAAKNKGMLVLGAKRIRLFHARFNPLALYITCAVWTVCFAACLVFGAAFAYYCMFAAVAFELAAAVYYTFQLK
mgnify:CR=1 FL=1